MDLCWLRAYGLTFFRPVTVLVAGQLLVAGICWGVASPAYSGGVMGLEFRPKEPAGSFDLYDETGKIGEISGPGSEPDDDPPDVWVVQLWSLTGSGKTWGDVQYSLEDALEDARESYKDLVAERREAGRGGSARVIPTPIGGQPRRR